MKNIGQKTSAWLVEIGINSLYDLEEMGALEAYLQLKEIKPNRLSLNALWALQGAILEIPWNELPPEIKKKLLADLNAKESL